MDVDIYGNSQSVFAALTKSVDSQCTVKDYFLLIDAVEKNKSIV